MYRKRPSANRSYRKKFTRRARAVGHPKDFVHYYKRKVALDSVVHLTAGAPVLGTYTFQLSDLPGATDFSNLYDAYKLKGVKMYFIPVSNVVTNVTGGTGGYPSTLYSNRLFTAIDYNDASAPTSVDSIREYQNSKWSPYNRIHKRWIRPKIISTDGTTTSNTQFPVGAQPWLPTSSASPYYGALKFGMDPIDGVVASTADILYRVEATYYLSFKNPK